ncbi:MAG: sensor histidine kinase [Limisphaerales bacterium]
MFLTATLAFVFFRSFPRHENDLKARYQINFVVLIVWTILFVMEVIIFFHPKVQNGQSIFMPVNHPSTFNRILPFIVCGLIGVACISQFFVLLKARRKLPEPPGFRRNPKRLPPLFWQAIFILLPVAGLACFGLYSLRQDRLLAEQEAQEAGEVLAQRLAQAISAGASQALSDYREVSFDLHANREADMGVSSWQGGIQSENDAWRRIKLWQQANPDIDLSTLPPAGRESYEMAVEPMPPQPPEWLAQLNPDQRQLWQWAKESEFKSADSSAGQIAIEKFIASKPPPGARANAEYLLLLAKTRGLANQEAAAEFASKWNQSDYLTEAGLPIGQLMCYQALRLMTNGTGVQNNFLQHISWVIIWHPSFFSEHLITEAGRVAKGTDSETKVSALKAWWEAGQKAQTVLENVREQYPSNTWKSGTYWANSSAGKFMLLLGFRFSGSSTNVIPPFSYLMIPQAVVERALATAASQSDISLPPYARVEFEMAGQNITLFSKETATATNGVLPVLGQADGAWKGLPEMDTPQNQSVYPFQIRVLLADPNILYAHQRQRTWMFGGLIVVSTVAALSALFAAYRAFRRQQALNELKSNFVSSVSHELRAPIASVRLMAENLERGKIQNALRQGEYFHFIVQECRRLSALIENVLDFSRIEQGRKQYEFELTDPVALTQTTVKLMEPYGAEKDVRLEYRPAPPVPVPELSLDGRAIQQALLNLIDNAIKHSPKGGTVTVGLEMVNLDSGAAAISLFVADHGPGIPPEEHEKIFERFYRLGSELRRETQGVGIGLSIVKHIVAAHHGRVSVQSRPGQGSRFTIELPIRSRHE